MRWKRAQRNVAGRRELVDVWLRFDCPPEMVERAYQWVESFEWKRRASFGGE